MLFFKTVTCDIKHDFNLLTNFHNLEGKKEKKNGEKNYSN